MNPLLTFTIVLLIGAIVGIAVRRMARASWLSRQIAGGRRADLTSALEKRLYLGRICEIVARLDRPPTHRDAGVTGGQTERSETAAGSSQVAEPNTKNVKLTEPLEQSTGPYRAVDPSECGETLSADRFYDDSYRRTLSVLVDRIVSDEGPVYFDVLVNRIARAHGFQRSGNNIHATILSVVDRRFPRSNEDGRLVLWSLDAPPPAVVAYRASPDRPYTDVPLLELAGLARAYLNLRMTDDEVLRSMGRRLSAWSRPRGRAAAI